MFAKAFSGCLWVVFVLGGAVVGTLIYDALSRSKQHAEVIDGPAYIAANKPSAPISEYEAVTSNVILYRTAQDLLTEFQRSDEAYQARLRSESLSEALRDNTETAESRYKGRRIQITGPLTGVFIPSMQTSERMLLSRGRGIFDEQGGAGSFITMGGPAPQSIADTLLLPGIHAWSKVGDSLQPTFGQPNIAALYSQLVIGKDVTLLCKFDSATGSAQDLEISLEDCVLLPTARPNATQDMQQSQPLIDNASDVNSAPDQPSQLPAPIERRPPTL